MELSRGRHLERQRAGRHVHRVQLHPVAETRAGDVLLVIGLPQSDLEQDEVGIVQMLAEPRSVDNKLAA